MPKSQTSAMAGRPESEAGPEEERRGIDWRKVMAVFVIFLLIGSVVVFFVLYALSLL